MKDYYSGIIESAIALNKLNTMQEVNEWCQSILKIDMTQNPGTRQELVHSLNKMCEDDHITIMSEDGNGGNQLFKYSLADASDFYKKITAAKP